MLSKLAYAGFEQIPQRRAEMVFPARIKITGKADRCPENRRAMTSELEPGW